MFNGLIGRVSTPLPQPRTFLLNHVTDRNKKRILRQIWTMNLVLAPYCFENDLFQRIHAERLELKCNNIENKIDNQLDATIAVY